MKVPSIAQRFDRRAASYDNAWTAFVGERELRQMRPLIPGGVAVLDYGCGSGRVTLDLLQRGCQVTAYDISPNMLARAKEKAETLKLAQDNVEFLTDPALLEGRTWPYITCIGVLDYYPDPRPLLRSLGTFLTENGRLIVSFPNALSPLAWFYALGSRLTVPALPRTPAFVRRAVQESGLIMLAERYAFPALAWLGHTLIVALQRMKHD